jgi:two-component system chemotaxis sensor kinase CheA
MDKDKLKKRLMAIFLDELEEHARTLEASALGLERDAEAAHADLLKTSFRAAHSLKGAARSAGVPLVETVCHRLEEVLGAACEGGAPASPDLAQLLLSAADALDDAGRRLRANEALAGGPFAAILARLQGAGPPPAPATSPEPQRPASGPGGAAPPVSEAVVRLPAGRLDALVDRSGELLVARRRAARRQDDVAALVDTTSRCLEEWRRLEGPLRKWTAAAAGRGEDAREGPNGAEAPRPLPRRAIASIGRVKDGLRRLDRELERFALGLASDHHVLDQAASPLEEEIRRVRMLRFEGACEGLERAVRDLARAAGKEVDLAIEGGHIELDRAILAGLRDALLHMVRNAVDHGIESPAERVAHGKPARGRITVAASLNGAGVEVVVADDGRGLDLAAIRERARERNVAVPEDERELVRLVLLPGFSTSRLVTELSGRGMGLDVVRHCAEALHGRVDVTFEPGRGARFALALPLTLTLIRALLVAAGGQVFALPVTHVRRLVRARPSDLGHVEGREVLLGGASPVPVVSLADALALPAAEPARAGGKVPLVIVISGGRETALAVDELLAEQEVVVKSLGRRLRRVPHFAGATVLPSGALSLILAPAELAQAALGRAPGRSVAPQDDEKREVEKRRLLVVDDSVTTRSLEKSILEAAGYEVLTAGDGEEAWRLLQEKGADLVVADVEMPRLDGFALTEAIRGSKRFRDLPVVLVTALETERDKARGLEVGADAYLPKSAFDQTQLLEVISRFL